MSEAQEFPLPNLPKIEYDQALVSPDCPYKVEVDPKGSAELLELVGVNPNDVGNYTIGVKRNIPSFMGTRIMGRYHPDYKLLEISTDHLWKKQDKIIKRAEKILAEPKRDIQARSNSSSRNKFPELTSGKRLSWYLQFVDAKRGIKMVEKLTSIAAKKDNSTSLLHEAKHAGEFESGRLSVRRQLAKNIVGPIAMGVVTALTLYTVAPAHEPYSDFLTALGYLQFGIGGTMGGYLSIYWLSGAERRARNFSQELKKQPKYKLIAITKK